MVGWCIFSSLLVLTRNNVARHVIDPMVRLVIPTPSREAIALVQSVKAGEFHPEILPRKVALLSAEDQAYVFDKLLDEIPDETVLRGVVCLATSESIANADARRVALEQTVRRVTISADMGLKAALMASLSASALSDIDDGLKCTLFLEIIACIRANQYDEVNKIVPAVIGVQDAIPVELRATYIAAMLRQCDSDAWTAAPAARSAVSRMNPSFVAAALPTLKFGYLSGLAHKALSSMLESSRNVWPAERALEFAEFLTLSPRDFYKKYEWG